MWAWGVGESTPKIRNWGSSWERMTGTQATNYSLSTRHTVPFLLNRILN